MRCVSWGIWPALGCLQRFAGSPSLALAKRRQPEPVAGLLPSLEQGYRAGSLQERSLPSAKIRQHQPGSCLLPELVLTLASATCGRTVGRKSHLLKVGEGAAPFLPSLPFPSWMHPAILGMTGIRLACDFKKTFLIMLILIMESFQIFLPLISSP